MYLSSRWRRNYQTYSILSCLAPMSFILKKNKTRKKKTMPSPYQQIQKNCLSLDCSLQLKNIKLESLVIASLLRRAFVAQILTPIFHYDIKSCSHQDFTLCVIVPMHVIVKEGSLNQDCHK